MKKEYVSEKTADGQTYYFMYVGSETHGRPTYIMWISKSFLQQDEKGRYYLEFPINGCTIKQGKKENTLILKKGDMNLYNILIECGYRGGSTIDDVIADEPVQVFHYKVYSSPRGSTGISKGALILTKAEKVKVKWSRGGRLYGAPASGTTILYADGKKEDLYCVEEEDLQELKEELETEA